MSVSLETALPGDAEQEATRSFYDVEAEKYFLKTSDFTRMPYYIREQLFSDFEPGDVVLDLGCGYGALLEEIPKEARYIGVDFSPAFIGIAKRLHPHNDWRIGDICNLDSIVTEQCRYFVASMVLGHIARKNLPRALASLYSRLLPKAEGLITTYSTEVSHFLSSEDVAEIPEGEGLIQGGFSEESIEKYLFAEELRVKGIIHEERQGIMYVFVSK